MGLKRVWMIALHSALAMTIALLVGTLSVFAEEPTSVPNTGVQAKTPQATNEPAPVAATQPPQETPQEIKDRTPEAKTVVPTTETVVPTTETVAPTTETVAPTTETVVPTTETVAPTTGTVAPTTEAVAPTTEAVAPTTGTVVPTTGTVAPTTEAVAPTTGTVVPTTGTVVPTTGTVVPTVPAPTPGVTETPTNIHNGSVAASDLFAEESFRTVWARTDSPMAEGVAQPRTWVWGMAPISDGMYEPYVEGQNGVRLVQYFDKSRMEINNPNAPRDQWYVTNGRLVAEMVEGRIQTGDTTFEERAPANEAVAGDPVAINPNAPTYHTLRQVAYPVNAAQAPERVGQVVTEVLAQDGTVSQNEALAQYNVILARYEPQLGHNIPQVFVDYVASRGIVYDGATYIEGQILDPTFVLGLPISEPYWAKVMVGGVEKDVLIQAFERRILTYTPDNAPAWRVEMGNVGKHYMEWRYQ